ncbi:glycoside hydrolase family 79 protein [Exidia glandulosa HHB12029]|uniref:Glycoside hydrolase family 79 protein n=1 Tax=Exidia glandulosa HHB12029 TaxID=1314781 RepID=A0A165E1U1_EXIGL|nr:glycoside hydrolase family 79 protein [Exidia glandulosa HHB12029]
MSMIAAFVLFATLAAAQSCSPAATPVIGVTVPVASPTNAVPLSQNLLGFSIESDRWPDWIGIDSPNTFWINTLENLNKLAGKPPKIRVGANSEDKTTFVSSQSVPVIATFPAFSSTTPYPEATNITIGPSFYTLSKWLPVGTHMTWGMNFGANNTANAVAEAKSIVAAFKSPEVTNKGIKLDFIELGNEPDLYKNNGLRPSTWTIHNMVSEWIAIADEVTTALGLKKGASPSWIALSFAGSDHGAGGFSPQQAFADGILTSTAGALISTISEHRYSGSFCAGSQGLLSDLMAKSAVRGNLTVFKPDIQATRSRGLAYYLGETNSYACHGAPGVSNTAGAAIWLIDYTLQAASLNIEEVYYHHGIGFKYNFMQPVALNRSITTGEPENTPARVQPTYYGAILIAEAVGTSGTTSIAEISINDSRIAGYAIYEGTKLVRAVFINSQSWPSGSTGARPAVKIDLLCLGTPVTTATVKRLKITHSDDTANLTWGGQSFETSTGLASGAVVTEHVNPVDGFVLSATEAVLLKFT